MLALEQQGVDKCDRQSSQHDLDEVAPARAIAQVFADGQVAGAYVMKGPYEADSQARCGRCSPGMPCVGRRFQQTFKACLLHAQTQIVILIKQEKALVEPTDMAERFRSQ
jgi:hypothetical protein